MARIVVHRASFESGTFPPVCCKTGVHTDNYERWEFTHTPTWTWLLIFFGVIPFLIVSVFTTTRFQGRLPMTGTARYRAARAKLAAWICGLGAIGILVFAMLTGNGIFKVVALALAVGWLISVALSFACSPNARPAGDDAVELSNVHRRFVETIEAAWAQRNAPSQPG